VFGNDWDKAEATIVAREMKSSGDGATTSYTYVADVRLESGETFRATIHEPTIATDFWAPSIRDVVSVLVKGKDRKVKFDKDDDRLSYKAYQVRKKQAFADAQNQPAGTPPAGYAGMATTGTAGASPAAWATSGAMPDAVAAQLAALGIVPGAPMQVVTGDSAQGQAALAAFAGLGAQGAPAAQAPEARLAKLQSLYEGGLLSAEEYAAQRQRILDAI
jgi:hypothetical protein